MPHPEIETDYVDESHIHAFAEALSAPDDVVDVEDSGTRSPTTGTLRLSGKRVRKVSALSDFAPVNQRVSRRRTRAPKLQQRTEWTYVLIRWPLLFLIFGFISMEFGLYILIRQLVNGKEWLTAWRGKRGVLRKRLRAATTYQEWKDAAAVLDEYLDFNQWKTLEEDPYYDWRLVRKVRRSLRYMRERNDVRGIVGILETCIRANFAGIESSRLYSETYFGTKDGVEAYISELEKAIEYVRDSTELSTEEKRRFFKSANTNFGTSALCLSGGASFGYYHIGVARAFIDAGLMPRVVSGTSAGGALAALLCTRKDEELRELLTPDLALRLTAFEEPLSVWGKRVWTTGARFDRVHWARKCSWFTRGSMTFKEAYMRTGRILNISVTPADRHSPTKLLNYLTAPDTVIWSALLASTAVPGILPPVCLMQKLKSGQVVPWSWGSKFKDGSLRVDIPLQALNLYFNVTHPVVSQVNPHVHLFFFAPRGSAGKPVASRKGTGWRGNFLLSAGEQWLKLELTKNFKIIRDLELLPQLLGQDWSSVFLQRFEGAVTIWPKTRLWDWVRLLTDPDEAELKRMIDVGQRVTWPKLHMIENRFRLEMQILYGRQAVRKLLRPSARSQPTMPLGVASPSLSTSAYAEMPLSVDTDAENAFARGAEHYFRRGSRFGSPQPDSSPNDPATVRTDAFSREIRRRKAVSDLFIAEEQANPHGELATSDPPPEGNTEREPQPVPPPSPSTFFRRLRTPSFPSLSSPFASMRKFNVERRAASKVRSVQDTWSSDSSEDDLEGRASQRFSRDMDLHAPMPVNAAAGRMEKDEPEVDV